jgi:hypothetical protein
MARGAASMQPRAVPSGGPDVLLRTHGRPLIGRTRPRPTPSAPTTQSGSSTALLERCGRSRDVVEVEIAPVGTVRIRRRQFRGGTVTRSRAASGAASGAAPGVALHMAPGLAIQNRVRPASGLSPESTRPRLLLRLDPEADVLPAPAVIELVRYINRTGRQAAPNCCWCCATGGRSA